MVIFLVIALVFSSLTPLQDTVSTEKVDDSRQTYIDYQTELKITQLENKLDQYLETKVPFTEQEFENMSDEELEEAVNKYFVNNDEFLKLEEEMGALDTGDNTEFKTIGPAIVPIGAFIGRLALSLIRSKGVKVATKYLKKRIKKIGKNYKVKWNVKNKHGQIRTLVSVISKKSKKKDKRVFAIDNGKIPLSPKTNQWFWHFHVAPNISVHRSLRVIVPKKYKPVKGKTVLY
ncbi:uberolysin/carnocyclin family circular bacteriocin [Virgibacillus proomii]|uniref:uberolysin/carnocyclin family circular bacteriocin n=1 Tax=Virgibacillus proomii TaxID=84407 RepID=UPI000985F57E|nr:uberolysin/carnocyclin family circular bacteriocin [Virgibacillus proomii]